MLVTRSMANLALLLGLAGCSTCPPISTEADVDLQRFMGDWYVIASIPTFLEEGAHNAVESYRLNDDGTIATTFSFRRGDFDGEPETYRPTAVVLDTQSNAVWGMQFVWPFKADYRIVYVSPDYRRTIIGRRKRDYAWIMARDPLIPEPQYREMLQMLAAQGYAPQRVRKVPQRWQ